MKIVETIGSVLEKQANKLCKAGRYEEAIFIYDQMLKLDSRNTRAWNNKGVCLTNLARHIDAISCYDKALDVNPKHLFALRNRSNDLIKLGKYEEALPSVCKALEIGSQKSLPDRIVDINNKILCENELIKIHEEKKKQNEEAERIKAEETRRQAEKLAEETRRQADELRELEKKKSVFRSNLSQLIREIELSADEKPCPKCNELEVLILSLTPNARSLSVRCNHCRYEFRIKLEPDDAEKIIRLYNLFLEERGICSEYGNDAVPLWKMKVIKRESTNQRKPIPSSVKKAVWKRDGGKCVNCGSEVDIEYDHIIPVAKGGSSTIQNIQILCKKCNRKKSASIE